MILDKLKQPFCGHRARHVRQRKSAWRARLQYAPSGAFLHGFAPRIHTYGAVPVFLHLNRPRGATRFMHIHILGICGTFMGGLAVLAREAGHKVTGCDAGVYPPMSTQLEAQGIELIQGYGPEQVSLNPDLYVVGNVMTRGNPLIEEILNRGLPYVSGPQWIGEHILREK